jgi:hypothetical protein
MEVSMKKTGLGVLLLMSAVLASAQSTALIREISGTVEVKTPGAAEWKAAAVGQTLDKAALVSTGFRGTALIAIGNSLITVRPLTRLSLEEIVLKQEGEQVTLNLRAGRIHAAVKPPAGVKMDFSIRSPEVTASVRGTAFDFDGTRLAVEEGRVHLSGASVTGAYIGAGHTTVAAPETGKTATAIDSVKEELVLALPVGVNAVPSAPAAAPSSGGLGISFGWKEE